MIVLGAAPERRARQVGLMGRIVHGAPCAVAVAPAGYARAPPHELQRIGVGFSDSPEARAAVALAGELASSAGAELRVIAGSSLAPALAGYAFSSPSLPLVEDELYAETKAAAERLAGEIVTQRGRASGRAPRRSRPRAGRGLAEPGPAGARLASLRTAAPRAAWKRLRCGHARGALPGARPAEEQSRVTIEGAKRCREHCPRRLSAGAARGRP